MLSLMAKDSAGFGDLKFSLMRQWDLGKKFETQGACQCICLPLTVGSLVQLPREHGRFVYSSDLHYSLINACFFSVAL